MILLAAAGALSLLAQVVLLRELVAALFGVELLYVIALGAWLVATALGAVAGRRWEPGPVGLAVAFGSLGAVTLAALALVRAAGVIVGAVPGAYLPFPVQLAGIGAATFPLAAICGALFPPLVRRAASHGLPPARAYAWECAGAAAGGGAVTAMFWWGRSTLDVALLTAALALTAATLSATRRPRTIALWVALLIVPAAGVSVTQSGRWDEALLRGQYPALLAARDTPYSRVVVTAAHGQLAVFHNGALAFDTEGTGAEAFADLSALQHPRPSRALVVGGGDPMVGAALLAHGPLAVDTVEIDERAHTLVRQFLPEARPAGTGGAAVQVTYAEPRTFLASAPSYDLILVATAPPTSGATSRFYTREFFALCRRHLAPDGVLAIRLPAAENFWTPPLARLVATIARAMAMEMPSVSIVPGATVYVFGSTAGLPGEADLLIDRLDARGLAPRLMTPPYLRYLYGNDRRAEVEGLLAPEHGVDASRDANPVCYRYAVMVWLSKFYPQMASGRGLLGTRGRSLLAAALVAGLAAWLWWARRTSGRAAAAAMFGVAAAAMVLESVALLRYQIANGVMFVNVGWLLTCFMAGMTAGAWGAAAPPTAGPAARWRICAGLAAVSLGVLAMTRSALLAGLAGTSVALGLTGFVSGRAFAMLLHERPGEPSRAAWSIYAADVAGGAAGAWLATFLIVPAAGLDGAAALTAAAAVAALPLSRRPGPARR